MTSSIDILTQTRRWTPTTTMTMDDGGLVSLDRRPPERGVASRSPMSVVFLSPAVQSLRGRRVVRFVRKRAHLLRWSNKGVCVCVSRVNLGTLADRPHARASK